MRFLHTADWHIGNTLGGHDMADDQAFAIKGIVEIAKDFKVDAIVIAGDLYERANPSGEAVAMLDEALYQLSLVAPVMAIAGNHDSGSRLDFGRRIMEQGKLHLVGTCHSGAHAVRLSDSHGEVVFHLMPFAMPEQVRFALKDESIRGHDAATARRIEAIQLTAGKRHVLVGHLLAQGGVSGETERSIAASGGEHVNPARFRGFSYVALGHLHRPHSVGSDRIRYSGSLCRCSFSEEDHAKSVSVVELDNAGEVGIKEVPIPQLRGMRTITGTLDKVLHDGSSDPNRKRDWIRVELTDPSLRGDAMGVLRDVYPHIASLKQPQWGGRPDGVASLRLDHDMPKEFLERFLRERLPGVGDERLQAAVSALATKCLEKALQEDAG